MKVALIGVGQCGGRMAEALAAHDLAGPSVVSALAVNTASADLEPLRIDSLLVGRDAVAGRGVGGDNERGAEIMHDEAAEVMAELDARVTSEAEAIVIVAGLGGGTGSGGAPVLASELRRVYDVPVYALGVLPGREEGSLYQANAGRSLKTLLREADSVLLVDNDAWHESGESVGEAFDAINEAIARRIGLLLAAGEIGAGDDVAESVVDSSEIINTLRDSGLAAVGHATAYLGEDEAENVNAVTSVVRKALLTNTSVPSASTAESALVVIAGPKDRIPRKGVERARKWVQEETGSFEVRGGDFPVDAEKVAAIVLLGGIERSDRVNAFLERAAEAQKAQPDEPAEDPAEAFDNDELDDLI